MTESDVKLIAIFFFLALLKDRRAFDLTNQSVNLFQREIQRNPKVDRGHLLVRVTNQVWTKSKERLYRGRPQYSEASGWKLPAGLDLGPWKELQKFSSEEELSCVIWSLALGISDQSIARGSETTEGTVRYRISKGLVRLGEYADGIRTVELVKPNE